MTRTIKSICFIAIIILFASCKTVDKINYMQDIKANDIINTTPKDIRLLPGDQISVFVKSKDDVLTEHFNISLPNMQKTLSYTIDPNGEVDFPMVGKIKLSGETRSEAAETIKSKLIEEYGVKDAIVTLDFANLRVSVLGEVNKPGSISIDKDNINILEALSMAGDMTIYGKRNDIMVVRDNGNQKETYIINLTSAKETMSSPAYYLKQNDIVYVPANNTRQRQATINGNNLKSTSFWISVASLIATIAVVIFK
jgi:Periplasmic protein involved in polysaccharide export